MKLKIVAHEIIKWLTKTSNTVTSEIGNLYKKEKGPSLVKALSGYKEGSKAFTRFHDIDEDIRKELVNLLD